MWPHVNCHRLQTNQDFICSRMLACSRNPAHQKYLCETSIPNFYIKTGHSKSYHERRKEVVTPNDTKSRNKKSEILKHPSQERLMWLEKIHRQLMKTVVLPQEKLDAALFKQELLHSFSTRDLMSMAMDISFVDKESMKIIVALWCRFESMTVEEILTTADIFFQNGVPVPWYLSAMVTYLDEMFESVFLTPLQLTRLVFHISCHGSAPPSLLNNIEKRISANLSDFDINLVAKMCQLSFAGQNRIKCPTLVDKIASKLLEELNSLNVAHFPMMMKMFRFSNHIKISFYKKLGDKLVTSKYVKQFYSQGQLMHVAFTYASVRVTHPQLFHSILVQCQQDHSQHRFKDIAKIIWACGTLVTHQEGNISCIRNILLQLRRNITMKQVKDYPDNLMDLLMGLALLNIYPYDLINMAFDPVILKILFGLSPEREKFFQLMFLDHSLSVECPDYSGFRLTEAEHITVEQNIKDMSLEMDMLLRKSVKPAVTALENVLGKDCVQCTFLLPHCRTSDILLAYDIEKKMFVKPVKKPLKISENIAERVFNKSKQDLVLLLLSRAQTTYDGQPLGLLHFKIRQLQALGYMVIMIDAEEAQSYPYLDTETIQKLLLVHISTHLQVDVSKYLSNKS